MFSRFFRPKLGFLASPGRLSGRVRDYDWANERTTSRVRRRTRRCHSGRDWTSSSRGFRRFSTEKPRFSAFPGRFGGCVRDCGETSGRERLRASGGIRGATLDSIGRHRRDVIAPFPPENPTSSRFRANSSDSLRDCDESNERTRFRAVLRTRRYRLRRDWTTYSGCFYRFSSENPVFSIFPRL